MGVILQDAWVELEMKMVPAWASIVFYRYKVTGVMFVVHKTFADTTTETACEVTCNDMLESNACAASAFYVPGKQKIRQMRSRVCLAQ